MRLKTAIIFINIAFLLGLVISIVFQRFTTPKSYLIESRPQSGYKFINPLLECDIANFENDQNLDNLKYDLIRKIDAFKKQSKTSHVSVYYRDLNNGPWLGINEKELFSPASLIKVPLMITYYKLAESNPQILEKKIFAGDTSPNLLQDFQPETTLTPNQEYSVNDLIEHMIIYSDNVAYDLLFANIENQLLIKTYQDLGINLDRAFADPNGNIISVKTYASFFRILFNASYLNKLYSQNALQLLAKTTFKQGLTTHLPANTTISHKYGERLYSDSKEKQLHDCGIVYSSKPYIVCIMTRGNNFDDQKEIIQNISATIYQSVSQN